MNKTNSVLSDVRNFLNIDKTSDVFDGEIIPHIMNAIGMMSQNGVGSPVIVTDDTNWTDVITPELIDNPEVFTMVPLYIMLSVKIIFDPPPPSAVDYYKTSLDDTLWRLRLIHDTTDEQEQIT